MFSVGISLGRISRVWTLRPQRWSQLQRSCSLLVTTASTGVGSAAVVILRSTALPQQRCCNHHWKQSPEVDFCALQPSTSHHCPPVITAGSSCHHCRPSSLRLPVITVVQQHCRLQLSPLSPSSLQAPAVTTVANITAGGSSGHHCRHHHCRPSSCHHCRHHHCCLQQSSLSSLVASSRH